MGEGHLNIVEYNRGAPWILFPGLSIHSLQWRTLFKQTFMSAVYSYHTLKQNIYLGSKLEEATVFQSAPRFPSWTMKQDRCQRNFPPVSSFKPCLLTHEQTHRLRGLSCQTCQNNTSFPVLCEAQCSNGQESLHMLSRESQFFCQADLSRIISGRIQKSFQVRLRTAIHRLWNCHKTRAVKW